MTEQQHDPGTTPTPAPPAEQEWNPLRPVEEQTIPLECSGGRASVTYRPWTGRERIAYEDAMTTRFLAEGADGGDMLLLGSLGIYATALTVVSAEGFGRDGFLSSSNVDDRVRDLYELTDRRTLLEITRTARSVQSLPRASDDEPEDKSPEVGSAEDPSQEPPTRPAEPEPDVDTSASPNA